MLKRVITGLLLVGLMIGLLFLRIVDARFFAIVPYGLMIVGSVEMIRALKDKLTFLQKVVIMVFALVATPVYVFFGLKILGAITVTAVILMVFTIVVDFGKTTLESVAIGIFTLVYPNVFLFAMLLINDLTHSLVALLLTFGVAAMADTFAFFVGSFFKGPKLSPDISPKKTISGAVGGIIGGVIGSVVIWILFGKGMLTAQIAPEILLFIMIGIIGSLCAIFGDLVEGAIKRKIGVKDLGSIFPGHGGVLDRVDGIMINSLFIYVVFVFIG